MARAIVRCSVSGEKSNQTHNEVRKRLEASGFEKIGTGSYEATADLADLLETIRSVMEPLAAPLGGGALDHLWVYVTGEEP